MAGWFLPRFLFSCSVAFSALSIRSLIPVSFSASSFFWVVFRFVFGYDLCFLVFYLLVRAYHQYYIFYQSDSLGAFAKTKTMKVIT